jgi:hypothetical protein
MNAPGDRPTSQRSLYWTVVGDVMVSLNVPGPSPDEPWQAFTKDFVTRRVTRYLGTAVGVVEVTSLQRKLISGVLIERRIPVAAVSDEKIVRGLVTAVSWLGVNIKAFSWTDLTDAVKHLQVSPLYQEKVVAAALQMRAAHSPKQGSVGRSRQ